MNHQQLRTAALRGHTQRLAQIDADASLNADARVLAICGSEQRLERDLKAANARQIVEALSPLGDVGLVEYRAEGASIDHRDRTNAAWGKAF